MKVNIDEQLHNEQSDFFFDESPYKALITGRGFGKTYVFALIAITKALQKRTGLIIAPTYTMLKDVVWTEITEMLHKYKIPFTFKMQDFILTIAGTNIYFRSAQNPDRIRGLQYNWFGFDEAGQNKDDYIWKIAIGGLREGTDLQAWITTTPNGHNWVYDKFGRNQDGYKLFKGKSSENKHLPEQYINALYNDYTGGFLRQEAEGEFVSMEGQIFKQENLKFYNDISNDIKRMSVFGYLDPATGSKHGDYSAFIIAGKLGDKIYLLDCFVDKFDDQQIIEQFKRYTKLYTFVQIGIESVFWQKKYVFDAITKAMPFNNFKQVRNTGKKNLRIAGIQPVVEHHVYFPEKWIYERNTDGRRGLDQLYNFNLQGDYLHDDFPDALEGVLQLVKLIDVPLEGSMYIKDYSKEYEY